MVAYPELASIRLGYGLSPLIPPPPGPPDVMASVARAGADDNAVSMDQVRQLQLKDKALDKRFKAGDAAAEAEIRAARLDVRRRVNVTVQRNIVRALDAPSGFGERLVQFWCDHFTVSGGNPYGRLMAAAMRDEAIRPHVAGNFSDMLFAAATHPRMLLYLNQDRSFGPNSAFARKHPQRNLGLNENLAREMIELHSLGVGADYTQADVRQLAELLTGLIYLPGNGNAFLPNRAEPGAETVLGRSYGGKGPAVLDDIRAAIRDLALHPATARHLAHKLAVHFVDDDPPKGLVDRMAAAYADSGGDLPPVYAVLATGPELDSHFRRKLRQPYDFMIAALRGLGISGADIMALRPKLARNLLIEPLTAMGQAWERPRGPDGWPEEAANWATPQGLAARINWAMRVPGKLRDLPDPRSLLEAALGQTASRELRWAVPKAESDREGVMIVLASADFNRR